MAELDYTQRSDTAGDELKKFIDRNFLVIELVTADAEARSFADPARAGLRVDLHFLTDGGTCTITFATQYNLNGDTSMVLDTAGQHVALVSIRDGAGGFRWQVTSPGPAQAAMTTALTDLSGPGIAPGTPDYAIQAITSSSPFGFVTADEAETVISVVQANKVRIAEIEAALVLAGLLQ